METGLKEIERQRRSYGNTISLASLKKYFCVKTRFSTMATTVATGVIIWKPGFKDKLAAYRKVVVLIFLINKAHL